MHKENSIICSIPCCDNQHQDILRLQGDLDTPFLKIHFDSLIKEAGNIELQLNKTNISNIHEIIRLQCRSLNVEKQIAKHIPFYLKKITQKKCVQYSGPVRARQARIEYNRNGEIILNYDFFYVPIED